MIDIFLCRSRANSSEPTILCAKNSALGRNSDLCALPGYTLIYVPLTALLTLPITFYEGFYREHQYGLSNLSFLGWFGETVLSVGVDMGIVGIAVTGRYAILRRLPASHRAMPGQ